jgi:hypothetical protein
MLDLSAISLDASIQARARIHDPTVASYAERMKAEDKFPPLDVFKVGDQYLLADGWHRRLAAQANGWKQILARIHVGTRQDAVKFAIEANRAHGLPYSNADKRHAVQLALKEFAGLSNHVIGDLCKVSHAFVGNIRHQLETVSSPQKRTGRDGKARKVPARKATKRAARPQANTKSANPKSTAAGTGEDQGTCKPDKEKPRSSEFSFTDIWREVEARLDHARNVCPRQYQRTLRERLSGYVQSVWPQHAARGLAVARAYPKKRSRPGS